MQLAIFILIIIALHIICALCDKGTQLRLVSFSDGDNSYRDSISSLVEDKINFFHLPGTHKNPGYERLYIEVLSYMPLLIAAGLAKFAVIIFDWNYVAPAFIISLLCASVPVYERLIIKAKYNVARSPDSRTEKFLTGTGVIVSALTGCAGMSLLLADTAGTPQNILFASLAYVILLIAAEAYELFAALAMRLHNTKLGAESEPNTILYLRSFLDEQTRMYSTFRFEKHLLLRLLLPVARFEEVLYNAVAPFGELITLGNPSEPKQLIMGAYRYYAPKDGESWKQIVEQTSSKVKMVVIYIGSTDSLSWELSMLKELRLEAKTIILFPAFLPLASLLKYLVMGDKNSKTQDKSGGKDGDGLTEWANRWEKAIEFFATGDKEKDSHIVGRFNPFFARSAFMRNGELCYGFAPGADYLMYALALGSFRLALEHNTGDNRSVSIRQNLPDFKTRSKFAPPYILGCRFKTDKVLKYWNAKNFAAANAMLAETVQKEPEPFCFMREVYALSLAMADENAEAVKQLIALGEIAAKRDWVWTFTKDETLLLMPVQREAKLFRIDWLCELSGLYRESDDMEECCGALRKALEIARDIADVRKEADLLGALSECVPDARESAALIANAKLIYSRISDVESVSLCDESLKEIYDLLNSRIGVNLSLEDWVEWLDNGAKNNPSIIPEDEKKTDEPPGKCFH